MIVTKKELDETDKKIIKLSSEGMTAKEIAYQMNISARVVEYKIKVMKSWYGCKSLSHLIATVLSKSTESL